MHYSVQCVELNAQLPTPNSMKFVCTQHDLNINLALVSRAVSTRPTHPVLANIKIEVTSNPDLIQLTGFDLSLGIQTSFMAQVDEEINGLTL